MEASSSAAPTRGGPATIFHVTPFQCSNKAALPLEPTAQALAVVSDATPINPRLPARTGLGTILHFEPFQCSIGAGRFALPSRPTAHTSLAEVDETAEKR